MFFLVPICMVWLKQENTSGSGNKSVRALSLNDATANERAISGSGGDDGEDGSNRPIPNPHSESANEVTAEDEEEEDPVPLNQLRIAPSSSQPATTKGKSPAHRQVRNQRNARRILDTWMVDDNPIESPNDGNINEQGLSYVPKRFWTFS